MDEVVRVVEVVELIGKVRGAEIFKVAGYLRVRVVEAVRVIKVMAMRKFWEYF